MELMKTTESYKFELGVCEETGLPILDMGEMAEFVSAKTGLTVEQIVAAQDAELEYMKLCGISTDEEDEI